MSRGMEPVRVPWPGDRAEPRRATAPPRAPRGAWSALALPLAGLAVLALLLLLLLWPLSGPDTALPLGGAVGVLFASALLRSSRTSTEGGLTAAWLWRTLKPRPYRKEDGTMDLPGFAHDAGALLLLLALVGLHVFASAGAWGLWVGLLAGLARAAIFGALRGPRNRSEALWQAEREAARSGIAERRARERSQDDPGRRM